MPISPEDIERAVFKERFRGYDPDEVDRFLDRVAAGVAELQRERDELAAQVQGQGGGPLPAAGEGGVDRLLERTLHAAQRTAEEVVADARRHAAELLEDTRGQVARDRDQSRAEAELVRRAVAELKAFRDEYRGRLHAIMSEQLAALDRAGELPRLPAIVERVAGGTPTPAADNAARSWAEGAAAQDSPGEDPATPAEQDESAGDDAVAPWDELWGEDAWRSRPAAEPDGAEEGLAEAPAPSEHGGLPDQPRRGPANGRE